MNTFEYLWSLYKNFRNQQGFEIEVFAGIVGAALIELIRFFVRKIREKRGFFTGTWHAHIYDKNMPAGTLPIKRDIVKCKQRGNRVKAKIHRVYPDDQKGRTYVFYGVNIESGLCGYYYSTTDVALYGTIFLRRIDKDHFRGGYVRLIVTPLDRGGDRVVPDENRLEWLRKPHGGPFSWLLFWRAAKPD